MGSLTGSDQPGWNTGPNWLGETNGNSVTWRGAFGVTTWILISCAVSGRDDARKRNKYFSSSLNTYNIASFAKATDSNAGN